MNVDRNAMTPQNRTPRLSAPLASATRLLRASATLLLAAVLGCNPQPGGQCTIDADCQNASVCLESVCVHPDLRPGESTHISIVAPEPRTVVGSEDLLVLVEVGSVFEVEELTVALLLDDSLVLDASADLVDGLWTATLPLGDEDIASGTYNLVAHIGTPAAQHHSAPTVVIVDRDPPSLVSVVPILPNRSEEHPAANAFVLGEEVILEVELDDEGAGVTEPPVLSVPGVGDVAGSLREDGTWRFRFDSRQVAGIDTALRVETDVSLAVADAVGNATTLSYPNAFRVDRRAWRWDNPSSRVITAAPAVVGDLLVFGDKDGTVFALDRVTGETRWTHSVGDAVVGHVASDGRELFVVTESGQVVWLKASPDGSLAANERETFRCPGNEPLVAAPPAGGVSVAPRGPGSLDEPLLLYVTSGGNLRLMRKSGFDRTAPETGTVCALEYPLEDAAQEGTVPALAMDDEALLVHVGLASDTVVRLRVEDDGQRGLIITRDWEHPVELTMKAPVSLAGDNDELLVLAAGTPRQDEGRVHAIDSSGTRLWATGENESFGGSNVESTAISSDGLGWAVDRSGSLHSFDLATGELDVGIALPKRDAARPRSTAVLGDDSTVYVPSGPRLSTVSQTSGEEIWSLDTRPHGTGTPTDFVDGVTPALDCDGKLFVVVNGINRSRVEALVTDSQGLARNGWPKGGRDNRNTSFYVSGDVPTCVD